MENLGRKKKSYILATVHRAENTDLKERLENIFEGLIETAKDQNVKLVMPMHPRTRNKLQQYGLFDKYNSDPSVHIIEPVSYLDQVALMKNAALIATDSGGIQKEAYFVGKPCVTLRDETEWVELIETGWNRLASPDSTDKVSEELLQALRYGVPTDRQGDLYGRGDAAQIILENLKNFCA